MDKDSEQNNEGVASSESILNSYEIALKEQQVKIRAYKNTVKSFGNALQFSISALSDLQMSFLAIYNDNWAFLQDILICFEDEHTIWKNFKRDVSEIVTLFRKYEDEFEEIENDIHRRKALLCKMKGLKESINELREKKDNKQACNISNIEKEYETIAQEFSKENKRLMNAYPKCFGRRVECLIEIFRASSGVMKEFCSEIRQVHETVLSLLYQLPNTNPRILIEGNEPSQRIELLVRESQSAKWPKRKESVTIHFAPGQIPPPPPPSRKPL